MNKKLHRSKKDKKIAGVAAGIGEYFDVDPLIVRLVFVVSALAWGFSIIIYFVMWFLVPEENNFNSTSGFTTYHEEEDGPSFSDDIKIERKSNKSKAFFAYLLIFIGIISLMDNIFPYWNYFKLWPIVLIGLGIFIIYNSKSRGK